jgi:alanine-synthesizing transaminase
MAGWRVGFLLGNARMVGAARRIKSFLDYGMFQAIQIAAIIALRDCKAEPGKICAMQQARRDVFVTGLRRAGWEVDVPRATMFVSGRIPRSRRHLGSLGFSRWLLENAHVAAAPFAGFVHGDNLDEESRGLAEEYVRFALIENEERLLQATRNIGRALQGKPLRVTKPKRRLSTTADNGMY